MTKEYRVSPVKVSSDAYTEIQSTPERTMPIFEYLCQSCEYEFEALIFGDEKASCPKCHGKKLAAKLSVFAVAAKGASAPMPSVGACGSCGDPRGPGACSRPDL